MPEWMKWITDSLAHYPAVAAALAAGAGSGIWQERKWRQLLAEHRQVSEERVAGMKRLHNSEIRAKNRRIRELERAPERKERDR